MKNLRESGASSPCHCARIKTYPDGSRDVLVCEKAIFKAEGWEVSGWHQPVRKRAREPPEQPAEGSPERAMRRARSQVRELALSNPFRWFVTLTLDKERIDRYDMAAITKKLNVWLDNNVRRRGLAYVLVPERHKDGAVHFHGLFTDALEAVDSGHQDGRGHPVFNLPCWTLGFSTAIELYGEYDRAVAYVCKYIGKGTEKVGGRWFYSGGQLARPVVSFCELSLRDALEMPGAYQFNVPEAGLSFVGFRLGPEGGNNGDV